MTLDNMKNASTRHFAPVVEKGMLCDVPAGEQGLSCASLEQIPDLKVVHICFIEPNDGDVVERVEGVSKRKTENSKTSLMNCIQ